MRGLLEVFAPMTGQRGSGSSLTAAVTARKSPQPPRVAKRGLLAADIDTGWAAPSIALSGV